jgi:hypothetical protein
MNFLNEIYWNIKFKIEDAFYAIKDKLNKNSYEVEPFVGEEYTSELDQAEGIAGAWEEKPKKKKKVKKKSVKKTKKSV